MRKGLVPLLLIVINACAGLSAAQKRELIIVKKSSVGRNVVSVEARLKDRDVELSCFLDHSPCSTVTSGEYEIVYLAADDSIYNDCTNVELYDISEPWKPRNTTKATASERKK